MNESGCITIDRSFLDWPLFGNATSVKAWLYLLLTASREAASCHGVSVRRGQCVVSLNDLCWALGMTHKQVRIFLDSLEANGEISRTRCGKYSVITIRNFDMYDAAGNSAEFDKRGTIKGTIAKLQVTPVNDGMSNTYKSEFETKFDKRGTIKGTIMGENDAKGTIKGTISGLEVTSASVDESTSYDSELETKFEKEGTIKGTISAGQEKEKGIKEKEEKKTLANTSVQEKPDFDESDLIVPESWKEENSAKEESCAKEEKAAIPAVNEKDASLFGEDLEDPENSLKLTNDLKIDYDGIVRIWNSTAKSVKIVKLSDERRAKLAIRFEEWASVGEPLSVFKGICERIAKSDFCRGANKTGWKATIDWIGANGRNWVKLYEGAYDNAAPKASAAPTGGGIAKDVNSNWAR